MRGSWIESAFPCNQQQRQDDSDSPEIWRDKKHEIALKKHVGYGREKQIEC